MNWPDLAAIFALSLAASLHCAQMCGPIVLSFSCANASGRCGPVPSTLAYNAGRILTYTLLGALGGSVGSAAGSLGRLVGLENIAALVAGGLAILAGIAMFGALRNPRLVQIAPVRKAGSLLRQGGIGPRFGAGLLLGLLPCGLIYAALLHSIASGSAVQGAASMLAFGLGTATPLLALGIFSSTVLRWFGRRSALVAASGVTLMGLSLVWRGLQPAACHAQ